MHTFLLVIQQWLEVLLYCKCVIIRHMIPIQQYSIILKYYRLLNSHRPWQIGVGKWVSTSTWWFSGSMLIYQRVLLSFNIPSGNQTWLAGKSPMNGGFCSTPCLMTPEGTINHIWNGHITRVIVIKRQFYRDSGIVIYHRSLYSHILIIAFKFHRLVIRHFPWDRDTWHAQESPVELVASPGLDLDQVNESSVGRAAVLRPWFSRGFTTIHQDIACICVYICILYIYIYMWMDQYVYVSVYMYMYMYLNLNMNVYIYIYIHEYENWYMYVNI